MSNVAMVFSQGSVLEENLIATVLLPATRTDKPARAEAIRAVECPNETRHPPRFFAESCL